MTWLAATVPGAIVAGLWTAAVLRLANQVDDLAELDRQFWLIVNHQLLTTEESDQP